MSRRPGELVPPAPPSCRACGGARKSSGIAGAVVAAVVVADVVGIQTHVVVTVVVHGLIVHVLVVESGVRTVIGMIRCSADIIDAEILRHWTVGLIAPWIRG